MSYKFWQIENMLFEGIVLQVALVELTSNPNDIPTPLTIANVTLKGYPLEMRANSEQVTITFSKVAEFRAVPEICSWPAYDDGEGLIIPCLLYEKPSSFFDGKNGPHRHEIYDKSIGWWVAAENLRCYIVHSESFDVYVLSSQPPSVN